MDRAGTFNGKASKAYIMQGKHQNLNTINLSRLCNVYLYMYM